MKNLLRNLAYASVIVASLAVVGHELAGTARATGSGHPVSYDGTFVATSDGDVYQRGGQGGVSTTWSRILSFPGIGSPVVAAYGNAQYFRVILENGDEWETDSGSPGGARRTSNIYGAATAVQPQTWSQIKAREWRK